MDVNGTRFHLLQGYADWGRCRLDGQPEDLPHWGEPERGGTVPDWLRIAWDAETDTLILRPRLAVPARGKTAQPLDPGARRGTARDRHGNVYWIASDRRGVYWQPAGSRHPSPYWPQNAPPPAATPGVFAPENPTTLSPPILAGLTVTARHYLVVGVRPTAATDGGLWVFDLHAGGPPTRLGLPAPCDPFALTAAPDGGLWLLDRSNNWTYWGLDAAFRVVTTLDRVTETTHLPPPTFAPENGAAPDPLPQRRAAGFPTTAVNPVAIAALDDERVLILDVDPAGSPGGSRLLIHRLGVLQASLPLGDLNERAEAKIRPLIGYDLTVANGVVYVVEQDGTQVIAFDLDLKSSPPRLVARVDYLPLHHFGGRALIPGPEQPLYDVNAADAAVRWVGLYPLDRPRYARDATLYTPVFDGRDPGCVWHRLFLDACLPPESQVTISSRVADSPEKLEAAAWVREPNLYLRDGGSELPFHRPFAASAPGRGAWETLLQQARGRYLQLRLEWSGNGRESPRLRALRVYYPRFSYPRRYLPAVYSQKEPIRESLPTASPEEDSAYTFLERLLANFEGLFSEIEGRIADARVLVDPRAAPVETLDWLAGWLGLLLDPLWAELQTVRGQATDRRRLLIRFARLLHERRGTEPGIRLALHLLLEPCLEPLLARLKAAAVGRDPVMIETLERYRLVPPGPTTSETDLEELLRDFLLARPSAIRLVERFLTRGGQAVAAGDPTGGAGAAAHRFSVLIPENLSAAETAMVRRIVDLEKPAHTAFDVRRYFAEFRVGEVRLGLDTALGAGARFEALVLGRTTLSAGYLPPPHPQNIVERLVLDRDRPGQRPL
jgi:phage tail-like protein